MSTQRLGDVLLLTFLVVACGEPEISRGPWTSEVSRFGDTMVVRTVSGSTWEEPARLVEELRLGQLEGEEETSFGRIAHVAVSTDGSIFIFDSQVPQISWFDASGEFLGRIGREGEGPGEYSARPTGMIVDGDRLLLADPDNSRLSAFSLSGEYLGSLGRVPGLRSLFARTLATRTNGTIVIRILTVEPGPGVEIPTPWPIALEFRDAEGMVLDTIPPQGILGEKNSLAEALPWGGVLVSSGSQFHFELRYAEETIRIEMPFERVAYTPAEVQMRGRELAPAAVADGLSEVPVVELKPPYLQYFFSQNEWVWARRPISDSKDEATWRAPLHQPSVLDVFDRNGTYLGVVPLPLGSRPMVVRDSHLYVVELGEFEEPYLVRYRIETQ